MKTMKILPTLFLLFLTVSQCLAESKELDKNLKQYDVEIIIFEDAHARYINSETWQQFSEAEISDHANNGSATLTETSRTNKSIENLDNLSLSDIKATAYKTIQAKILKQEYKRINASSEYNVLFYGAWRQAGLKKTEAFEINVDELDNNHKTRSKAGKAENTIAGHVKLVLARYLHFYGELNYQRNTDKVTVDAATENVTSDQVLPEDLTQNGLTRDSHTFPMSIHRRMRSKELHYIDHPLVGILIQVNPVKVESAEKDTKL